MYIYIVRGILWDYVSNEKVIIIIILKPRHIKVEKDQFS